MVEKRPIDFAERVRELREKKGLSQTELAKAAGLTPTALSRLLAGERALRMDHAVALAKALAVSVVELTQATSAEGVVRDWVPRSEFDGVDRARAEAEQELDLVRATEKARDAETAKLRDSVRMATARVGELEGEAVGLRAQATRVEALSRENSDSKRLVHQLQAENERLKQTAEAYKSESIRAKQSAHFSGAALRSAVSQIQALENDLKKAQGEKVGVAVVTGALGTLAGLLVAAAPSTSRGRSRG